MNNQGFQSNPIVIHFYIFRTDSNGSNNNVLSYGRNKLSNTSSNLGETNGIGRNYKPASRSNSNNLFQGSENYVTNGVDIKSSAVSYTHLRAHET